MPVTPWILYILTDLTGKLYIGITSNLEQRLNKHKNATGTMHTAKLQEPQLAYTEAFSTRQEAAARERTLKHLPREKKLALITPNQNPGPNPAPHNLR